MELVITLRHRGGQVHVALSGGDAFVTHDFLQGKDVAAIDDVVGAESVPNGVGAQLGAGQPGAAEKTADGALGGNPGHGAVPADPDMRLIPQSGQHFPHRRGHRDNLRAGLPLHGQGGRSDLGPAEADQFPQADPRVHRESEPGPLLRAVAGVLDRGSSSS